MTISQRVFDELKKQGKSQKDLAAATGISTSTISSWKKHGTNPLADSIYPIAVFLSVSTDANFHLDKFAFACYTRL